MKSALRLNAETFFLIPAETVAFSAADVAIASDESSNSELVRRFFSFIDALFVVSAKARYIPAQTLIVSDICTS